jgi:hypothetical protein
VCYAAVVLFSWAWGLVVHSISGDVGFADITRYRLARILLRILSAGS